MSVKEVKQAGASTAKLATLVGKAKQFIIDKTTWRPHIMDGSTPGGYSLAFENEVLKLIAQTLTPEQKAQVVKNLEGTFLPLAGGEVNGQIKFPMGAVWSNNLETVKEMLICADKIGDPNGYGAWLALRNNGNSTNPGSFALLIREPNGDIGPCLEGIKDGRLVWNGKEVTSLEQWHTNAGHNFDCRCFRLKSPNVQFVFGSVFIPANQNTTVTFPLPFSGDTYDVVTGVHSGVGDIMVGYFSATTTSCIFHKRNWNNDQGFDCTIKFMAFGGY